MIVLASVLNWVSSILSSLSNLKCKLYCCNNNSNVSIPNSIVILDNHILIDLKKYVVEHCNSIDDIVFYKWERFYTPETPYEDKTQDLKHSFHSIDELAKTNFQTIREYIMNFTSLYELREWLSTTIT